MRLQLHRLSIHIQGSWWSAWTWWKNTICQMLNCVNTIKEKYKKLEYNTLSKENCKVKDYLKSLNLPDARMKFSIRTKMTRTVQMNYKGEPKFAQNKWKCQDCGTPDTQEHIIRCPSYQHLRSGKNLESDKDLVEYFRRVIQIRDKSEDQESKWLTLGRSRPAPAQVSLVPVQNCKRFVISVMLVFNIIISIWVLGP